MGENNTDLLLFKLLQPIERLDINLRAYHVLKRENIQTVADIVYLGEKNIRAKKNMGALLVSNVFTSVASYLDIPRENLSTEYLKQIVLTQSKEPMESLQLSVESSEKNAYELLNTALLIQQKINLGKNLAMLKIRDRTWTAIELRANHLRTLEETALEIGGVTRERARQIIEGACEKVNRNLDLLTDFLDYFELKARKIQNKLLKNDLIELKSLISKLNSDMASSNLIATDNDTKKLITLIRILVIHRKSADGGILTTRWECLTFLCCFVEPPIGKHDKVNLAIDEKEKNSKKLCYKELAYSVLQKAHKPMHWTEIAEDGYKINNRANFDTRGIYHALLRHEDIFVRVGQGTYELVEWGNKTVDAYPDIIASVLKQENRAMSFDVIFAKVSAIRHVKSPSFIMYLDLHPRFYKAINQLYGLRGWLPPREKQTLRTPEWLVEDSKSLERVERSENRGYNIDKFAEDDKLI